MTQRAGGSVQSNDKKFNDLAESLAGSSRRERQNAAAALAILSHDHPELLLSLAPVVIEALDRPEAQTRWECLDILTNLVDCDSRSCDRAIPGAESSLFDEDSGPVRLAAMRFLCKLGATTENRSEKVWPLIDEGIQCCHGDLEFQDMLSAIIEFSAGKLSPVVKQELVVRMKFDAENGKGPLKRKATQIIEQVQG